jgi:hypothetical protein
VRELGGKDCFLQGKVTNVKFFSNYKNFCCINFFFFLMSKQKFIEISVRCP